MTDRHNIYELFEEIHMEAFANQSVGNAQGTQCTYWTI